MIGYAAEVEQHASTTSIAVALMRTADQNFSWLYSSITQSVQWLMPKWAAEALMTLFGIWTAILPLLIWAAWSAEVLFFVLLSD